MIEVNLTSSHTHAGVNYHAGDTLKVDELTAKWMIEQRIGVIKEPKQLNVKTKGE